MEMHNVTSSNLRRVGYDKDKQQLVVEFHSGATWGYGDVSEREFNELLAAPSVGSYFHKNIKLAKSSEPI